MKLLMLAFAFGQQYHVMRLAEAAGHSVYVLGKDFARGLKYSRFCSGYYPFDFDPVAQSLEEALEKISQSIEGLSIDIVLPSDTVSTRLLAALSSRLPIPSCALPDPACFDMLNDKWRFYQFCRAHNVSVPKTQLFEDAAQIKAALSQQTVTLPFTVKPLGSMSGWGVRHIRAEADLGSLDALGYNPVLVQNFIQGRGVDISVVARRGRIGAYAIQQNRFQHYTFLQHDSLLALTARVVEASQFHGVAHFDAIEEDNSRDIYLIECNPRFWFSIYAAAFAGLNFVELSLNPDLLNLEKPLSIPNADVYVGGVLIKRITRQLRMNHLDRRAIRYSMTDPVGKLCGRLRAFNDDFIASGDPGSIDDQVAALAAIGRLS